MPGEMSTFRIVFHLYLILSFFPFTLITAVKMRLYPSDIKVDAGEWATVTCKVPCELEMNRSHTFKWFVGDHRIRKVESDFEERTGIKVEYQTTRSCTGQSGYAYHQLRVFASSVERVNRTAVQCAALRKGPAFTDYYSYFAVILVKDELQATTESPTETVHTEYANSKEILEATTTNAVYLENADSNESDVSLESHIAPTQCQPEIVTVTVTHTPTPLEQYQ